MYGIIITYEGGMSMNDSSTFNGAMGFYDKTLSAADDIIRALIAALARKSNDEQKKILEDFAKHLANGKGLRAIALDRDRMNAFAEYAKNHNLTYYSVRDRVTGTFNVIYKDSDEIRIQTIADEMRENGRELFKNPQKSFSEFIREHESDHIMYQRISSFDDILLAKQSLSAQGVDFALAKNEDASYIVVFDSEDTEAIQKSGMVNVSSPAAAFNGQTTVQEIRTIVREKREQERKTQEREMYKDRGR